MLKLTQDQLKLAYLTAKHITQLEVEKDGRHFLNVGVRSKEDPLGQGFEIPRGTVASVLNTEIAKQHAVLRELGIELVHGGGSGG